MRTEIDRVSWSGEGELTQRLVEWFAEQADVAFLRVEDATSSRSDVGYNFISNEIYLRFHVAAQIERRRLWGVVPVRRTVATKTMTIDRIETLLSADDEIGPPDYADESMIQYLYTKRVVPPYQTKGYKLVELVRVYEVGTPPRG